MITKIGFFLLLAGSLTFWSTPAPGEGPLPVVVSIAPQKYFVEKIGGAMVTVETMVPTGATPEQYEPKPKQMKALGKAKLYFACGVPFEAVWLPRMAAANPGMRIVQTDKNIEKREMEAHSDPMGTGGHAGHSHGHHDAKDPHIWLSPPLVKIQARTIFEALTAADPRNSQGYDENYKRFISELTELDLSLKKLFEPKAKTGAFMVFHPAWGYFADAYGLKQVPVELEGKEPKARDLDNLIKLARRLGVKTIFIQPQYSPKSAQTIAKAIGGNLVHADDLAPDWAENLRQVAGQIATALVRD